MCNIIPSVVGALIAGGIGLAAAWWRWRRDGRDQFKTATADIRSSLDEAGENVDVFFTKSIPIIRQAVYHVRPFAKNWSGLYSCWKNYEKQNPEHMAASFRLANKILEGSQGDARLALSALLNQMDDYVS